MDLVRESRKILDSLGLLSKKYHDPERSPNFIGNKAATKITLDTSAFDTAKNIFISESVALDHLRIAAVKEKKKIIYYDRKLDKVCVIDKINKNTKGQVTELYGTGKTFKGIIDLICFMGLFFSVEDGVVIYDKKEFGEELVKLRKKMFINSNTKYLAITHDKLEENINAQHFMNTDNYIKAHLIVTPANIFQFD